MGTRRSKAALKSFLRFSGSSVICFLLDYGLFTLLNSVLLVSLPDGTREQRGEGRHEFTCAVAIG